MLVPNDKVTLRPYQQQCLDALIEKEAEHHRQYAVLPTGSGKTIVMAKLAEAKLPDKTLILAHREDLIDQAQEKVWNTIGIEAGVEMNTSKASKDDNVVIASVQSAIGRLDRYAPNHFDAVIIDECHHAVSGTFQKVLNYFGSAPAFGFTATEERNDKNQITSWFDNRSYEVTMPQLIPEYLCPVRALCLPTRIDMTDVSERKLGGFYHEGTMHEKIMPLMRNIAEQIKFYAGDRKTVVFLPLIQTSQMFAQVCREVGLEAKHIDGQMNKHDKKEIKSWLRTTKSGVLCNSMLLTEGFDEPSISAICNLRPTSSLSLYQQIVGRGMRKHDSKNDLLLLDFLFQAENLPLVRPAHLFTKTDDVADLMTQRTMNTSGGVDLMEAEVEASQDAAEQRLANMKREIIQQRNKKAKTVNPIEFATWLGDLNVADYQSEFAWQRRPMTDNQCKTLENNGINTSLVRDFGHADALLKMLKPRWDKNLATAKQIRLCRGRLGHPNPEKLTKAQAGAFISSEMKRRGWK